MIKFLYYLMLLSMSFQSYADCEKHQIIHVLEKFRGSQLAHQCRINVLSRTQYIGTGKDRSWISTDLLIYTSIDNPNVLDLDKEFGISIRMTESCDEAPAMKAGEKLYQQHYYKDSKEFLQYISVSTNESEEIEYLEVGNIDTTTGMQTSVVNCTASLAGDYYEL